MALYESKGSVALRPASISPTRDWSPLATGAFIAAALLVGVVAGVNPLAGALLAMALVFALIVTWDLAIGVCGFVLLTFLDVLSAGSALSLTKAAGALLVGGWLAAIVTTRTRRHGLAATVPRLPIVLFAFLAWSLMSALWAEAPGTALDSTLRFALNAMLFPIVFLAVREHRHVVWILATFIVGALLSVAWGLTVAPTGGASAANAAEGRLSGATVEANVLAVMLMVAILFAGALSLTLRRRSPLPAALAASATLIALMAFFATLSRGGLVAFLAVIVVGIVYGGRLRPAIIGVTLAAVVVGGIFIQASPAAAERFTRQSTSGRSDLWTVGGRMVRDRPVIGVGSGNFQTVSARYLLYPGVIERDDVILDAPLVAHNNYLHVLAEMGAVGLALFLGVLGLSVAAAVRAVAAFSAQGRRSLELLGRAVVLAVIGILAAGFFSSEQYSKQLWLLLAMGPALLALARQAGPAGGTDATHSPPPPGTV